MMSRQDEQDMAVGDDLPRSVATITEILDRGELSHPESLRGRALAVRNATITDQDLFDWYLEECARQPTTRANYASQLRRLTWFATKVLKVPTVRLLQREDWKTFEEYLKAPPADHIMERSVGLNSNKWRPFRDALSPASSAQAQSVVKSFYAWMADPGIGALKRNPFGKLSTRKHRKPKSAQEVEHFVGVEQWPYVYRALAAMPAETPMQVRAKARAKWAFELAMLTGLRASEISAARSSMIKPARKGRWELEIVRKGGGQASKVPLTTRVMDGWRAYRETLAASLDAVLGDEADLPLVGQIQPKNLGQAMTRQSIWNLITETCKAAAEIAKAEGEMHHAAMLTNASPHWMRHTYAVQLVSSGAELGSVQDLLEHSSIATTSIYLHVEDDKRAASAERMSQMAPRAPQEPLAPD